MLTLFLLGSSGLWATGCPEPSWRGLVLCHSGRWWGGCPMLLSALCPLPSCLQDLGPCGSPGASSPSAALPWAWLNTLWRRSGYTADYTATGSVSSSGEVRLSQTCTCTAWFGPPAEKVFFLLLPFQEEKRNCSKRPVLKTLPLEINQPKPSFSFKRGFQQIVGERCSKSFIPNPECHVFKCWPFVSSSGIDDVFKLLLCASMWDIIELLCFLCISSYSASSVSSGMGSHEHMFFWVPGGPSVRLALGDLCLGPTVSQKSRHSSLTVLCCAQCYIQKSALTLVGIRRATLGPWAGQCLRSDLRAGVYMLGVLERNETEEDFGAEAAVCSHSMAIQEVGIGFPEAVRSEDGIGAILFLAMGN